MELYLVKDKVNLLDLKKFRKNYLKHPSKFPGPDPDLEIGLEFPCLVKPVVQSESGRELAAKLKDVVIRDNEQIVSDFHFYLCDDNVLQGDVIFDIDGDEESEIGGFSSMFVEHNRKFKMSMTLSLCHLATKNTPVVPEALLTLNEELCAQDWLDNMDAYGFFSREESECAQVQELWDHEDGFIYSKLTIVVTLSKSVVRRMMRKEEPVEDFSETGAMTRKMLKKEICTDLEIRCGDGKIVKAHRAVLSVKSKVFHAMFQAEGMEEARTGELEMVVMSEQSVRAFLRWMYWEDEKKAVSESDVAVELLIAGDKYDLEDLVEKMKEIVVWRRGGDEDWFSVESALKLYNWARNLEEMEDLKERAVCALKFFGKTYPEKLMESEEYQELIKNDAEAARELTQG